MAIFATWLAARALNFGIGMASILDPDRVARILNAPEGWRFAALLCIGYPATDDDTPLRRRVGW